GPRANNFVARRRGEVESITRTVTAGGRRSGLPWLAREWAADDRHCRVQRRDQSADAVGFTLYVAGLRPRHSKPQPCDLGGPVADRPAGLSHTGLFRRAALADAVPGRDTVRCQLAGIDPHRARDAAASRREADADAAATARPRSGEGLHVEHGADRIPRHAL